MSNPAVSTGLPALDRILHGVRPGDNIVWQVDTIDSYLPLVEPFVAYARDNGFKTVYFRFAQHQELVSEDSCVQIYRLRPEDGYEMFISRIHSIIQQTGRHAYYVFDSLSELAVSCFSERMLGNFFRLTCPYLYELGALAYFAVIRNYHSYYAALPIAETTQLLIDVFRYKGETYIHPHKVEQRHSPTMFTLHLWQGDDITPVTESTAISAVLRSSPWHGLQSASYRMVGMWDRRFMQAEELLAAYERGECSQEAIDRVFRRQLKQLISCDSRILALAEKYLTLSDIIYIWKRLIGSGMVGGKSVGMLIARAILEKSDPRWTELLEPHDSFFVGSDIFYSFLIENDCWSTRQNQKDPTTLLDGAEEARQRILQGRFPTYIVTRFSDMLDYFGQAPIVVRSSSLLEDNFGNSFSGKYESVFCSNQGTKEQRLQAFLDAVRRIYASAMSEEALTYRARRGALEQDEQMALLIQRVSGKPYGDFFFPQLAGVGLSYNPYVWDESIDPNAGVLRLVFGLGTRAVDRHDDDYTRVVSLNAPTKRPEADSQTVARYTQRKMDMLDLARNSFVSDYFADLIKQEVELPLDLFASLSRTRGGYYDNRDTAPHYLLTFDRLFSDTALLSDMRHMLDTLRQAYDHHVDIEFAVNISQHGTHKINLLQCRPLQIVENVSLGGKVPEVDSQHRILEAHGGIIGHSKVLALDRLIYVDPTGYAQLANTERYAVARLIGRLTHLSESDTDKTIMLMGPGRWGTSTPALGVPVSFAEINTVSVLCEMDIMHEHLVPDLSLGTHFFNDLVEMDMLYIGFFTTEQKNSLNQAFFDRSVNRLAELRPGAASLSTVVRVIDAPDERAIHMVADAMKQRAMLYLCAQDS